MAVGALARRLRRHAARASGAAPRWAHPRGPGGPQDAPLVAVGLVVRSAVTAADAGVALGQRAAAADAETAAALSLPALPAKRLVLLLSQPGALPARSVALALECALRRVEEMDGKDCVRLLRALAAHAGGARLEERHLQALGAQLSERLGDISTADMAELVGALADASLPALPVYARLSAAFGLRCAGASAPQLTRVAVAFSRVRLADRRLFPRLGQSAVKQLHHFGAPDLPAFLAAFAAVGLCHEVLLTAAAKVVVSRAQRLGAIDLALVAYAYAQFFLVYPAVVSMLSHRLPACAHELPAARLAELAVSCARLQVRPPQLLATFDRDVSLSGLSGPLFGEAAKALAQLGLAGAPGAEARIGEEVLRRLGGGVDTGEWALNLLECLGEAAEDARRRRGGACPHFLAGALLGVAPHVERLCPALGPGEVAGAYRCLRQLPRSLASPSAGPGLRALHEALAARAGHLAAAEAFSGEELTSVLFSQMCLCPELLAEEEADASGRGAPVNPQRAALRASWDALRGARGAARGAAFEDPRSRLQDAMLDLALAPRDSQIAADLADSAAAGDRRRLAHMADADGAQEGADYRERIARLSDKLCVLHAGLDQDRNTRFEHLQGKMRQLDEKVCASQDSTGKKFSVLKGQLLAFQSDLDEERSCRERLAQDKQEEIARVDEALQGELAAREASLAAEQEARRESEARVLQTFEAKTRGIREEMQANGRLRMDLWGGKGAVVQGDNEANLRRYLEVDIPKLYESLKEEVGSREAMEQRMLRKAMEEVTQLQGAVLAEKKEREDTEEAMLRMMEEVVAKMQGEIAAERRERERTEERLQSLLSDTCEKLQSASHSL
ncbi:unnamed protein product [Prorocentrum cordatum]|uniref:RNA-editing substrate-binding complex 6 protein domain-containing protein n=1 Tax=Prorocentrum cordatum TaxID=2364126 RepID=A0ABN9Y177_9DINO|nr:unnamed protein product [Polarella glacialis]